MPGIARSSRPRIGVTADATSEKYQVGRSYASMIVSAGGVPIILPCIASCVGDYLDICDGFVFTGGDDPIMTRWGIPMHPNANPLDPARQEFELALLEALERLPAKSVLGVCLGMQLMGLHAGGQLDQYLPDSCATADAHWSKGCHLIEGELGRGQVHSHHRQALTDAGSLRVVASAPDGVIEGVTDDRRRFYVGVQWHPERTADAALGAGLFVRLVESVGHPVGPIGKSPNRARKPTHSP